MGGLKIKIIIEFYVYFTIKPNISKIIKRLSYHGKIFKEYFKLKD